MISKSLKNKGYLLVEVFVTIIVLGVAIVFITRALNSSLSAVRRAATFTKALFLMDEIYCDIKLENPSGTAISLESFPRADNITVEKQSFDWKEELKPSQIPTLSEIVFTASWKDSRSSGEISASTFIPTIIPKGE